MSLRLIARPFELDDRDALVELFGYVFERSPLDHWRELREIVLKPNGFADVALVGGTDRIVGVSCYAVTKTRCEIVCVAVTPGFQRQGVARHLLRCIQERTWSNITTWVPESGLGPQLFFRKHGFVGELVRTPEFDRSQNYYRMIYRRRPFEAASAASDEVGR